MTTSDDQREADEMLLDIIDGLSYVDEATDPVAIATTTITELQAFRAALSTRPALPAGDEANNPDLEVCTHRICGHLYEHECGAFCDFELRRDPALASRPSSPQAGDDTFKPNFRVRNKDENDPWIEVQADGVEPQTYYDRDGKTIYAGIWFQHMEVERLSKHATDERIKLIAEAKGYLAPQIYPSLVDILSRLIAALESEGQGQQ